MIDTNILRDRFVGTGWYYDVLSLANRMAACAEVLGRLAEKKGGNS